MTYRWIALVLASLGAVSCVPYVKYQELSKELDRANEINEDYKTALKDAQMAVSEKSGNSRFSQARLDALQEKYEAVCLERDGLREQVEELQKRWRDIKSLPLPNGGFSAQDSVAIGLPVNERGNLILPFDLIFSPGSAALRTQASGHLDKVVNLLQSQYSGRVVHIDGHTDNDPIRKSKNKDNWELSVKRAHSVFRYLVDHGVEQERFRLHGHGYTEPPEDVNDPSSDSGKMKSRRVEIRLGPPNS